MTMTILYFDCFSGISGDMTLGALIDLGADVEVLKNELLKLDLTGYEIRAAKKLNHGIAGTDVEIILKDEGGHHHGNAHDSRTLMDIETLITASGLADGVKRLSIDVFREIAIAEAKVHNKEVDAIHFHEVGAADSILDIVGMAICLNLLGVEEVYSSHLHDGQGFIECQHGLLPVPVPAVMEMAADKEKSIQLIIEDISTELVTPTGMGIIKCLAAGFGKMPPMVVEKVGYGLGKRETGRLNALRIALGSKHFS